MDVSAALVLLAATAPVTIPAALLVRFTSPGPALFRQERVGLNGAPFEVLKLRTMYADADQEVHRSFVLSLLSGQVGEAGAAESKTPYKIGKDSRITPVGAFLRRWSIDELPQLVNVLKGEMSLVGPRPDVPYAVAAYEPWQRQRLAVLPGLTGLWQVSGRGELSPSDMLELDVRYVRDRSLALDLRILLRTVPAVLSSRGAR